jgi:hypothetical protein
VRKKSNQSAADAAATAPAARRLFASIARVCCYGVFVLLVGANGGRHGAALIRRTRAGFRAALNGLGAVLTFVA